MALSYHIPFLPENIPFSIQLITISLILGLIYFVYAIWAEDRPWRGFPIIALDEKNLSAKDSWFYHGKDTITKGLQTTPGAFQVMTGTGPKIVLPNRFADELKNVPTLSFFGAFAKDLFIEYPGFEAFKESSMDENFLAEVVRVKLTQSLGLVTADLVEETTSAVHDIFGEGAEWREITLKDDLLQLVARLSSRVFLGKKLCRNERWLEIAKGYTVSAFTAARELRKISPMFRRIAYEFMDHGITLRAMYRDAGKLITPEIERRKVRAQKALDAGQKPPKVADTVGWMYELAREKRQDKNYVAAQLSLTLAAIHTTTEAMTQALYDLCAHPEFIEPLREEVATVVGAEGWSKTALYKLKLVDSFLKESQRFKPPSAVSMNRLVQKSLTLSDGTVLPAGARVLVAGAYRDTKVYETANTFDPYRFYRERQNPEHANSWQHVTVSPQHMAFGYGSHACPGRFFASNELKIALAHLLLKYDWKMVDDGQPVFLEFETSTMSNPKSKVQLKRREEGIDLGKVRVVE